MASEELGKFIGFLLGAAGVAIPASGMVSKGIITGPSGQQYPIFGAEDGAPLASTSIYRLYIAQLPSGQLGLMKIVSDPAHNRTLEDEARLLQALQLIAGNLDQEAERQGDKPYHYGAFLPKVVESMTADDGRFLAFLGFHPSVVSYKQLRPLPLALNSQRVDLQTVVWILKSLKVLDFSHRLGNVAIGFVDASNLLLETEQHGVFFFDWSSARQNPTEDECLAEVAAMAKIAWMAAGGTDTTGPPHDLNIMDASHHAEFVAFLRKLMAGRTDADKAHTAIYEMSDRLWPREQKTDEYGTIYKRPFHEWVTYPT